MANEVAFISTGGTIAPIGRSLLDLIDCAANNTMMPAQEIITTIPSLRAVADREPGKIRRLFSTF